MDKEINQQEKTSQAGAAVEDTEKKEATVAASSQEAERQPAQQDETAGKAETEKPEGNVSGTADAEKESAAAEGREAAAEKPAESALKPALGQPEEPASKAPFGEGAPSEKQEGSAQKPAGAAAGEAASKTRPRQPEKPEKTEKAGETDKAQADKAGTGKAEAGKGRTKSDKRTVPVSEKSGRRTAAAAEKAGKKGRARSVMPLLHLGTTTADCMALVILALLPAAGSGIYHYGVRAMFLIGLGVASAVVTELLWDLITRKGLTILDYSAVVTGLSVGLLMPPAVPYRFPVIASVIAILGGKMIFGGIGKNIFNPAAVGKLVLVLLFPAIMGDFSTVTGTYGPNTPLLELLNGNEVKLSDMLTGNVSGCIGTTSVIALLIGALILMLTGVIDAWISLGCLVSFTIFYVLFGSHGLSPYFIAAQLCGGSLLFTAFFMANDYTTSPVGKRARVTDGILLGILIGVFRCFTGIEENAALYALLITNALTRLLEVKLMPRPFGTRQVRRAVHIHAPLPSAQSSSSARTRTPEELADAKMEEDFAEFERTVLPRNAASGSETAGTINSESVSMYENRTRLEGGFPPRPQAPVYDQWQGMARRQEQQYGGDPYAGYGYAQGYPQNAAGSWQQGGWQNTQGYAGSAGYGTYPNGTGGQGYSTNANGAGGQGYGANGNGGVSQGYGTNANGAGGQEYGTNVNGTAAQGYGTNASGAGGAGYNTYPDGTAGQAAGQPYATGGYGGYGSYGDAGGTAYGGGSFGTNGYGQDAGWQHYYPQQPYGQNAYYGQPGYGQQAYGQGSYEGQPAYGGQYQDQNREQGEQYGDQVPEHQK